MRHRGLRGPHSRGMVAAGGDMLGYVRYKLGIWEAIFADLPDDPAVLDCHGDSQRATTLK